MLVFEELDPDLNRFYIFYPPFLKEKWSDAI